MFRRRMAKKQMGSSRLPNPENNLDQSIASGRFGKVPKTMEPCRTRIAGTAARVRRWLSRLFNETFSKRHWMDKVIERTISIFGLMRTPEAAERARNRLSDYLKTIASAGETDHERLVVCGLTYLREQEPENDPVPRGYSGL